MTTIRNHRTLQNFMRDSSNWPNIPRRYVSDDTPAIGWKLLALICAGVSAFWLTIFKALGWW